MLLEDKRYFKSYLFENWEGWGYIYICHHAAAAAAGAPVHDNNDDADIDDGDDDDDNEVDCGVHDGDHYTDDNDAAAADNNEDVYNDDTNNDNDEDNDNDHNGVMVIYLPCNKLLTCMPCESVRQRFRPVVVSPFFAL